LPSATHAAMPLRPFRSSRRAMVMFEPQVMWRSLPNCARPSFRATAREASFSQDVL
jgi:hypothetical protein